MIAMYMRSGATAFLPRGRRAAATAAAVATRSTDIAVRYGTAGDVMFAMNQLSLGRNDPGLRNVKGCIDQAVLRTFDGHANVQHQGSTRKGTGLAAGSDWDFFVHLDNSIPPVTHKQRMAVVELLRKQLLPSAGIDYSIRCGSNRVFLWNGSDGRGVLPDVDVVFHRFKSDVRCAPKSKALAHSQVAQQVVKYIKRLPVRFSQLAKPKSSLLERLVLQLQQQQFGYTLLKGKQGFEDLLTVVLTAIADAGGAALHAQALVDAQVVSEEWREAAQFVMDTKVAGVGWVLV